MNTEEDKLLNITKAAHFLGVHYLTLRNWADKGHIPFYRTPGGHRRFKQKDLHNFLSSINQGGTQPTLETKTHTAVKQAIATLPGQHTLIVNNPTWQEKITPSQRDVMRSIGRKLLTLTVEYVSAGSTPQTLGDACKIGEKYGQFAAQHHFSMTETVATFNFFKDTIIKATFESLAESATNNTHKPDLYNHLNHFFSQVLLATIQSAEAQITES